MGKKQKDIYFMTGDNYENIINSIEVSNTEKKIFLETIKKNQTIISFISTLKMNELKIYTNMKLLSRLI